MPEVISVSQSPVTPAVRGEGFHNEGVRGISHNSHGGVAGVNDWSPPAAPPGGWSREGALQNSLGVPGRHDSPVDPVISSDGAGVYGQSKHGIGVFGESDSSHGVSGESLSTTGGAGVHGKGARAGLF